MSQQLSSNSNIAMGIVIGAGFGVALGLAVFRNLAIGIAVGAGLGIAIGALLDRLQQQSAPPTDPDSE